MPSLSRGIFSSIAAKSKRFVTVSAASPFYLLVGTYRERHQALNPGGAGQSPCATDCFRSESRRPLIMRTSVFQDRSCRMLGVQQCTLSHFQFDWNWWSCAQGLRSGSPRALGLEPVVRNDPSQCFPGKPPRPWNVMYNEKPLTAMAIAISTKRTATPYLYQGS